MIPFPEKKYDVILADPPWQYRNYAAAPGKTHDRARGAQKHYPTMTIGQLSEIALPVGDRAALFMWATWPLINDAMALIEAWGFAYKTLAWEWIKTNKKSPGYFMGMGYYTRSNPEPCLLAFKGKAIKPEDRSVTALIVSPVGQHSRKPDEQYDKIERLYPGMRYLEMFARQSRPGWDAWGNEAPQEAMP